MLNGNGHHAYWQPFVTRAPAVVGGDPRRVAVRRNETPVPPRAPADVYETTEAMVVLMDLPGHQSENIDVRVENGVLTIRSAPSPREREGCTYLLAERLASTIERTFQLPSVVDPERIDATFDNGVLSVTLPKREESKPRKIDVKASS